MFFRSSGDGPDCEMTMRYFMHGEGLGNLSVSFKVMNMHTMHDNGDVR